MSYNRGFAYECKTFELAIALDHAYVQAYGGAVGAIAQSINIMNMVAGDYKDAFATEVHIEIVEHYISNCSTCDPWGPESEFQSLINDFASWANTGFANAHDIGQLLSDKDLYGLGPNGEMRFGYIGYAMPDAVCSPQRYHIVEDYSTVDWNLRVLTSHEIGHNFGATHDGFGAPYIMASNVINTNQWSNGSIITINRNIPTYTCASSCNSNCDDVVILTDPLSQTSFTARDTIKNQGTLVVNQALSLDAPNVALYTQFCINNGVEFTIVTAGCP